jgi:hypothetical protein
MWNSFQLQAPGFQLKARHPREEMPCYGPDARYNDN